MKKTIFELLDNAVKENGYTEILKLTPLEIAKDIIECTGEFEIAQIEEMIPHIEEYLQG